MVLVTYKEMGKEVLNKLREMLLVITMWIVTICTYASYVPQIIKMMKTKRRLLLESK